MSTERTAAESKTRPVCHARVGVPERNEAAREEKCSKTLVRVSPRFDERFNPAVPKGTVSLMQEKLEKTPTHGKVQSADPSEWEENPGAARRAATHIQGDSSTRDDW